MKTAPKRPDVGESVTDVPCSGCGARPGAGCKAGGGRPTAPHGPRRQLWNLRLAELERWEQWHGGKR